MTVRQHNQKMLYHTDISETAYRTEQPDETIQEAFRDMENVIIKHRKKHKSDKNHNIRAAAAQKKRDRERKK